MQAAHHLGAHHVLRGEVPRVDEVEALGVQKVVIPQVAGDKGIAALGQRLGDVLAAGPAAYGHPVHRPPAVAVAQAPAT